MIQVEEEIGYDLRGSINEQDQIQTHINSQHVTMFIVPGVPEATLFEAQTRNEIGVS
jgi:mRNA-decapping enzyme subunit 2